VPIPAEIHDLGDERLFFIILTQPLHIPKGLLLFLLDLERASFAVLSNAEVWNFEVILKVSLVYFVSFVFEIFTRACPFFGDQLI
jgi:hypothetical protein